MIIKLSKVKSRGALLAVLIGCMSSHSCTAVSQTEKKGVGVSDNNVAGSLAGTRWRLVEIQSMDDAIGTTRPHHRDLYTMDLNADGTVAMRLNCNRGRGTWSAKPVANKTEGGFQFGPLATTRALCSPRSLDQRIAKDVAFVRSFLLRDGRLYLSLKADGGIYVWEPRPEGK